MSVTLALPPDTDTPGFAIEEKGKLEETRLISNSAGLFQSETVAKQLIDDALVCV
jgi:3-dehydrosphinganine reductase